MSNNKELQDLIRRYEQTLADNKSVYFDADQFSDIAEYYDNIGDIDAARDLLEIALKIHPESESLLLKKAKIFVYDNEYEQALHLLNIVFSGYDYDLYMVKIECFLQLSRYEEAMELVSDILDNEENEDFHTTLADLGFLYIEADCFTEAITFFEQSLNIDPENLEVLSDLSYAYETLGNFEKAIDATNRILDIDAYSYDAWVNLGKLYSLKEEYAKAVDAFDFALTINDNDINIIKLKAHCLSLSNRAMEAMIIFKELLVKIPEDTSLYLLLCECYANLELYSEALECLVKYEELDGETIELALKKASLFYQMDKMTQALSIIEKAMETYGKQLDLLILSGDIKMSSEDNLAAELDFKEAYLLESDNFEVIDKLALVSITLEKYDSAIKYTEELLLLEPENMSMRQRLALLFLEIDDKDNFNATIDTFSDEELMDLFQLFYQPQRPELFDRDLLIASLNEAREYRTLFKNLRH